jgi:phospholipase C
LLIHFTYSLIILNFDEHGGFADHVAPPMNVPIPEDGISFDGESEGFNVTFNFDRLGVR